MSRRTLAGLILLAWVGALAWLVRREYYGGEGSEDPSRRWPVSPGAAFLAARLGDRQIGLASITVDTVGDSLRLVELTTLDLPSARTGPVRRTSAQVIAVYSRGLKLLRWQTDLLTEDGRRSSTGTVAGDSLLTEITTREGDADTLRLALRRPVVLPGAMPLVLASRGLPRSGTKLNLEVFDPLDRELRLERIQVTAESLFTVPDSAEWSANLRRWIVAHQDTVRAWRLEREEHGLPVAQWTDASGLTVRVSHPLGAVLERSAFELVNTNFRAHPPARWDTSAAAPGLAATTQPPDARRSLRSVATRTGGRPLGEVPPGLRGGNQSWSGDTVMVPAAGVPDSEAVAGLLAEPLLADDGTLAAAATTILGSERRPEAMARLLNNWVRRSITIEAGPGGVSAVHTLARRRGTLDDRQRLLAGLGRAAGLEARRVWGLALVEGRWQQRGWVEFRLGGWTPVDPAVTAIPPDAARVRLATGGDARLLDLVLRAGALRLSVLEDSR